MNEIAHVRNRIAPYIEQYQVSRGNDIIPHPDSVHAARVNAALTELSDIINSHHPSVTKEMDKDTFLRAETAVDTLRHTHLKLHQRSFLFPGRSMVDMGLASAYQKGQSYLLSVSGTDHADALLWQFTNRHLTRGNPGLSEVIVPGGSRQLWPPTSRTIAQTRSFLNPRRTWFGKQEIGFEGCRHSVKDLKGIHRDWAIKELMETEDGMNDWERSLIIAAIVKSGGTIPYNGGSEAVRSAAEEEELYGIGSDEDDDEEVNVIADSSSI